MILVKAVIVYGKRPKSGTERSQWSRSLRSAKSPQGFAEYRKIAVELFIAYFRKSYRVRGLYELKALFLSL